MVGPVIPDVALADLKTLQEAGLSDRAVVERWVTTTAENEEVSGSWVEVAEAVPVQYVPLGTKTAELAAAVGVVATGLVKQRVNGDIRQGDRVVVRGVRSAVRFQYMLDVGPPLQSPGRTILRMAVTATDLTKG